MYENATELLCRANKANKPLSRIILENEMELQECGEAEIRKRIWESYTVMQKSSQDAPNMKRKTLISGHAASLDAYRKSGDTICGDTISRVMARSLSCLEVNAAMGKICAAPTAGACGILPAVVITLAEQFCATNDTIEDALITAAGIGAIVMANATVSGAEGGCQAECGVAAAMAAGAAVCIKGGTGEQILSAASLALLSVMGLVCDPVGGYVQVPCAYRNATQALSALGCADMALAGIDAGIPFDEVVQAMSEVGEQMPAALRETAEGGTAATPTGRKLAEFMQKQ